jgi:predicted DNA-binding transcriptional regulator AlpA
VEQVLSKKQVCEQANISDRTLDRETAAGRGPVHTQLGLRRWGVTVSDFDAWLASRRKAPPGWVDAPSGPRRLRPARTAA